MVWLASSPQLGDARCTIQTPMAITLAMQAKTDQ